MKRLLAAGIAIVLLAVVAATAWAGDYPWGRTYTFGGIGPSYSVYSPGAGVKVVVIHAEAPIPLDFAVNGVTYRCPVVAGAFRCTYGPVKVTGPFLLETGTGSYWWIDVDEYLSDYTLFVPSMLSDRPVPTPGPTSTPLPAETEAVNHPFSEVVTSTQEVQP